MHDDRKHVINEYLEAMYLPRLQAMYKAIYVCEPYLYVFETALGGQWAVLDKEHLMERKKEYFYNVKEFDTGIYDYVRKYSHGYTYHDIKFNHQHDKAERVLRFFYARLNRLDTGSLDLPPIFGTGRYHYFLSDFVKHFKNLIVPTDRNAGSDLLTNTTYCGMISTLP